MSKRITTFEQIEQLNSEVQEVRKTEYPVTPLFLNRWSHRSYEDRKVTDDVLNTILEAASWAPSASNQQPWRFIVAKTEEQRQLFQTFIKPGNRLWTDQAPVLVLLASATLNSDGTPNVSHAFDTGAAWASLAFQAHLLGLSTRAVGGFDKDLAREVLNVPSDYELHAVIALGYRAPKEALHESLQEREKPTVRRPLAESIIEGKFV